MPLLKVCRTLQTPLPPTPANYIVFPGANTPGTMINAAVTLTIDGCGARPGPCPL
jgi:hypothetical protein